MAQSIVSPADPTTLAYPYTRHIARALDAAAPAGAHVRVVHLGAGALTLARYVAATRPGCPQLVVECEPELYREMLAVLPLPPGSDVRVIFGDAREVADAALPDASQTGEPPPAVPWEPPNAALSDAVRTAAAADWVGAQFTVVDLWDAAVIHPRVASREFFARVAARCAADAVVAVNLLDGHPFDYARRQAATLATVFAHVAVVLEADPFDQEGPLGNVVLFARDAPLAIVANPAVLGTPRPHLLHGGEFTAWVGAARVMTDEDGAESPDPNDPRWD